MSEIERAIKVLEEEYAFTLECDATQKRSSAYKTALTALRAEQDRLNPQPLAWEELSGMVGEPVWTIGECCGLDGWDIIEEVYEDSVLFGRSTEQPERWRYNLRNLNGELSGCAWVCYRPKPEGSAE
jgi:hypothetical protein